MRIAFNIFGGKSWTGGINYLVNLLSAISEIPDQPIKPILFTGYDADPDIINRIKPYLAEPPIQSTLWTKGTNASKFRKIQSFLFQRDFLVENCLRENEIDLVFQHANWHGFFFGLPTLVWIGDFQHKHLPQMFTPQAYLKREIGFQATLKSATTIMVMSKDAQHDCETFYPTTKDKIVILPFAVKVPDPDSLQSTQDIKTRYQLPEKFFFLPNQFWKHKNHLGIIKALNLLQDDGNNIAVVASGNIKDLRNPEHYQNIISTVKLYSLEDKFKILGLIPYLDMLSLMRASVAVINPSFYEGWSTTVEEAKSIGVPTLLSDLKVFKEQAPLVCDFFDPNNIENIANILKSAWEKYSPGPHFDIEKISCICVPEWRMKFAKDFLDISEKTLESWNLLNQKKKT